MANADAKTGLEQMATAEFWCVLKANYSFLRALENDIEMSMAEAYEYRDLLPPPPPGLTTPEIEESKQQAEHHAIVIDKLWDFINETRTAIARLPQSQTLLEQLDDRYWRIATIDQIASIDPREATAHCVKVLDYFLAGEDAPLVSPAVAAVTPDDAAVLKPEDKALALLMRNPTWGVAQIAKAMGVSRTTPYDWPTFMAARELLKQGKAAMPSGKVDGDGSLEAWRA